MSSRKDITINASGYIISGHTVCSKTVYIKKMSKMSKKINRRKVQKIREKNEKLKNDF